MTEKTIFEKIRDREVPGDFEYEDDEIMAFRDIKPAAPVHVLIVPKRAYPTLEHVDLDDELAGKLIKVARQVAKKLGIDGNYRLQMNVGPQMQEVPHIHLHLLGGWAHPDPSDPESTKLV